ncbi:MAG TPA: RnfABCDGE type electron transport complex subunit B [Usitatibacteraceae bacterium]
MPTLAEKIDALLPQTQCTKCGYAGCMPYAEAIAAGEAGIDCCPPGGDAGIAALAKLLGRAIVPLDTARGEHLPHRIAVIDEATCIGCAKCLAACPTDAIVGASKLMHTVIAELCTGCDLCIPPCPVDCISMAADPNYPASLHPPIARTRFQFHNFRLARDRRERDEALAARERAVLGK